ncbi:MAG: hypothetical protein BJBARM4_0653 [Candidatus Parvarchaeum acidiphilum ARMAN-4]|jgi:hypothetical protein|uniref:Uncharacterized protein n=1 Tax=Candidatus Parvarchaeum acidiphilum ARMAN-4 TaxID=662760 RepID=D2EFX2_PARA4|nr:MAG: hypothetical protein BJBARM4_0653 [Candidatus Parvarchaeum acidiphilum ARMAN-4]
MKGQINFSAFVLITAIIAILVLVVFDSAIRSYIITNFSNIGKTLSGFNTSLPKELITNFTAYNCSYYCSSFSSEIYSWTINYNGQNYSAYINSSISVVSEKGNYSLEAYPILLPSGEECANGTSIKNYVKRLTAGKNYTLDYSIC